MLLLWSTILYKTTFVLKDGYKFYLSMFVTASFAHSIAVKLEWGLFLCVRAYFCAFLSPSLYNGASWWSYPQWRIRTDQWPRTPSPLAPSQSVQKQKETESKSARNNTTEQWVWHGGSPPAQTNTPVHMQEVIILTRITLRPDTPYYYGYTLLAPMYSWY